MESEGAEGGKLQWAASRHLAARLMLTDCTVPSLAQTLPNKLHQFAALQFMAVFLRSGSLVVRGAGVGPALQVNVDELGQLVVVDAEQLFGQLLDLAVRDVAAAAAAT